MKKNWWKEAVVYQVYWRSFYDANGDGFGDLEGVSRKLDYLSRLGVDIIWLNPFFESPDIDLGYDVSDYYSIMDKAGTMADFENLVSHIHSYGMRVIMDMVLNHTSDQHSWFIESRSSIGNPKRNYYIWRDQPTNWVSRFTPSAWEYDKTTDSYYFHSYAIQQPDLNWKNPEVRQEIYRMMRFWLEKGVDGFRLDSINFLAKLEDFPDQPDPLDTSYYGENPGIHDYLQEMVDQVTRDYDVFLVGEIPFVTPEKAVFYTREDRGELNSLFHFEVCDDMENWNLPQFRSIQQRWYQGLWEKGWNSQFLNNHDHPRLVSRFGNDTRYRVESAKLFATMLHTLPGTPYVYQGEEIGMTSVAFPSIEDYRDIAMKEKYREWVAQGQDPDQVLAQLVRSTRDNSRTPMQWDDGRNASFTSDEPWIKVNPNYRWINVQQALSDPNSIFFYYQRLILLRKQNSVIVYGSYLPLLEDHTQVYAYLRVWEEERWLILLNIAEGQVSVTVPDWITYDSTRLMISNYPIWEEELPRTINMQPYEARVYQLS